MLDLTCVFDQIQCQDTGEHLFDSVNSSDGVNSQGSADSANEESVDSVNSVNQISK